MCVCVCVCAHQRISTYVRLNISQVGKPVGHKSPSLLDVLSFSCPHPSETWNSFSFHEMDFALLLTQSNGGHLSGLLHTHSLLANSFSQTAWQDRKMALHKCHYLASILTAPHQRQGWHLLTAEARLILSPRLRLSHDTTLSWGFMNVIHSKGFIWTFQNCSQNHFWWKRQGSYIF